MYEKFKIMAQKYVFPLFMKDTLGGFDFSSTMTFIKRNNEYFCIFAAHAIPPHETTLKNIGAFIQSGQFTSLEEISKDYTIDRDNDLVICRTTSYIEYRNYFDLDVEKTTADFKEEVIAWIGFPKKKAKQKYHRTRATPDHVAKDISTFDDGRLKLTNAKYLLIGMEVRTKSEHEISAHFEDRKVNYDKEGYKEQAYSLKGMSGGALFHPQKNINMDNLSFKLAGIGLKHYSSDKIIKGASASLVTDLIDKHLIEYNQE